MTNEEVEALNPWLRFAPAICLLWVGAGVVTASSVVLLTLLPFSILGAALTGHPFDVVYNHGLRYVFQTPKLPPYGRPRRFACLMASLMIAAAAGAFYLDSPGVGYLIGGSMIGLASVQVLTGFCVPSFIHNLIFGQPLCALKEPADDRERKFESISPLWPK